MALFLVVCITLVSFINRSVNTTTSWFPCFFFGTLPNTSMQTYSNGLPGEQIQPPLVLAVRMVLYARAAVTYSYVRVIGDVGPVQLLLHGVVRLTFAMVAGQNGIMTQEKEVGA